MPYAFNVAGDVIRLKMKVVQNVKWTAMRAVVV